MRVQQKIRTAQKLWHGWYIDDATGAFCDYNQTLWRPWRQTGSGEVLCNLDTVALTHVKFSYLMNVLAQEHSAVIKTFSSRSPASQRRLYAVYQSFNTQGYISVEAYTGADPRVKHEVARAMAEATTKQGLFDLKIFGIWLGVDIYETYLMKGGHPTVDVNDPQLHKLIEQTAGLVLFWKDYFEQHDVRAVGTSIDGYTANNTVAKVAQAFGVPVFAPDLFAPRVRDVPFAASVSYAEYPKLFAGLSLKEQERGRMLAKQQLDRRMAGEVGVNMGYSTKSAWHHDFSDERVVEASDRLKVLICSHDFIDAPHSHGGMIFTDFVEWLMFLASIAHKTDYDWYIKLHPDHHHQSSAAVENIQKSFPRLTIVPASTSHHQLIKEGLDVVLTCYGSVGHEYPLYGIPVLNAGYNPHISYSFNNHARSQDEYRTYLMNLSNLRYLGSLEDIYEFYYMYHYEELADFTLPWLRDMLSAHSGATKASPGMYRIWQKEITGDRHKDLLLRIKRAIFQRVHHVAEV